MKKGGKQQGVSRAWFEVRLVDDDVYAILEPHHAEEVISYLILGADRCVLLDTGMGIDNIQRLVKEITDKPITVVNSHYHWDHVGDNHRFSHIAIHSAEASRLEETPCDDVLREAMRPENFRGPAPAGFDRGEYRILPSRADRLLEDGEVLELGGRRLRVVHTPGHSPGSICLWSEEEGLLFSGDTVYAGPLYAQLEDSDFAAYKRSMKRLAGLAPGLRIVLPGHNCTPLEAEVLLDMAEGFEDIAAGRASCRLQGSPWGLLRRFEFARFAVLMPARQ
jgi:glyoxylase-like metal-dependent hydrolase (beta-lactamase superfamily II)